MSHKAIWTLTPHVQELVFLNRPYLSFSGKRRLKKQNWQHLWSSEKCQRRIYQRIIPVKWSPPTNSQALSPSLWLKKVCKLDRYPEFALALLLYMIISSIVVFSTLCTKLKPHSHSFPPLCYLYNSLSIITLQLTLHTLPWSSSSWASCW